MDIEPRVIALEVALSGIQATLARMDERLAATATAAQVEYLRGRVEALPTTWQLINAIVAGQVALAGLIAAVVFGVAHLMGKV